MPRQKLYDTEIWFGTADAPAPSGTVTESAPAIVVGTSKHLKDAVFHVRYRRPGGPWQYLRLNCRDGSEDRN